MKDNQIKENEAITKGLEDFLDQELGNTSELKPIIPITPTKSIQDPILESSYDEADEVDETDDLANLRLFPSHGPKKKKNAQHTTHPPKREDKFEPSQKRKPEKKPKSKHMKKHNKAKKKHKKAEKKKSHGFWKVLLILILILLIVWYLIVGMVYHKMQYDDSATDLRGPVSSGGVTNILLIGNDARTLDEMGRSDAMILLTISNKTHTMQMTSLLRDMYVDIPGHDGNRINAAYSYGGPQLLCQTIEQNLGIKVNHYVIVNFHAFAALVDAVGGIDLEVSNEEVQWINAYLNEYNLLEGKEMTTDYLDTSLSGVIHLNGPQSLAYSRNRYIGTDFGRTERQRKVLGQIMKKLPLALVTNTGDVINGLFPNLKTNLTQFDCYLLSFKAGSFLFYESEQNTIPADGTYSNKTIRDMAVLSVDFDANKKIWNESVYGK